jgi:hypothetical protein
MRHDRGLSIFGELQLILRPLSHKAEEILAQSLIDLVKNIPGRSARIRERGAHADGLAALSRKNECAHQAPLEIIGRG